MSDDKQSEALQLADALSAGPHHKAIFDRAAAELRRLDAVEKQREDLLKALKRAEFAMSYCHWNWRSDASDDFKRNAHKEVCAAIARSKTPVVSGHAKHDRELLESLRRNMNLPPYNASLNPCAHDGIMWVHLVHQYGEQAVKAAAEYLQKTEGQS